VTLRAIIRERLDVVLPVDDTDEDRKIVENAVLAGIAQWLDSDVLTGVLYDGLVEGGGFVRGALNAIKRESVR
jgi:hypothetical protein